jgi:hypothetical protein
VPRKPVLEGEGPWGLSDVQSGVAEALGENVLLTFNFLREGHAHNHLQLILGFDSSRKLADSLHKVIEQVDAIRKSERETKGQP